MDLSDLVSVRKFQEFDVEQKEELYETLLELAEAIEEIPKKSLRKTLDITFAVLRFKGEQILGLQEQLEIKSQADSLDESHNERLLDENEKLKRMLGKLEEEKQNLKHKIKELTDEILNLQKRLQDAAQSGEVSDKDSSDPLSELDKQEELLKNINAKNKHIKRLLREIEALQTQNIEQSKAIIETEKQLQQAKAKVLQLSADITLVDSERKALKETVNELHVEISRLEGNITYLEEERDRGEKDLKDFIEKLETKAQSWKKLLDEKDVELKKLRSRLGDTAGKETLTESSTESDAKSSGDGNAEDSTKETTKLLHAIESRDKLIEQLELKIKTMAEEMISSTRLMNKLTTERQEEQNAQKPRSCCKLVEESLHAANERCRELSEMLERCEENSELKSKQAMQAITALDAYQRGEDGLVKSLRKCASLEQKLKSRDKQIQALVMELNSLHEIAHENILLRKRLNIPEDVVIATKNLAAKERSKDKIIDRLTLKLRASEEIRLQLKMEKADLRSELIQLQKKTPKISEAVSLKSASEVGEVEDSTRDEEYVQTATKKSACYCNCHEAKLSDIESDVDTKHQEIIEENDILRLGMFEILEKLREYDAASEHITIDTEILLRLLQALQSRSSSTAMTTAKLQIELQSLKAREKALRELVTKQNALESAEIDELASVESIREDGEVHMHATELQIELPPDLIDTSTRPTTPNKNLDQSLFPIIQSVESFVAAEAIPLEQMRELQIQISELEVYRQRYEELKLHIGATECELGEYCKGLVEKLTELELINAKKSKIYEYLRKDYDQSLTELKQNDLQHITAVADLKKKICQLSERNTDLENLNEKQKIGIQYTTEEFLSLQRQNAELQAQLAFMVEQIFAGKITPEFKINDICTDYGIIRENMQLDYLTIEEYEKLQKTVKDSMNEKSKWERKCAQLEGLLEIANEQILSQQKIMNEIADNHINLRHLVADLQSTTEDKLIMAKIQRDLDSAKNEIINIKFEREQLQQKCSDLELEVKSQEFKTAQMKEDFQSKQRYKDTKLKFLQKSIFALKDKYAKFTPLIFLTNFIFAHAKFAKRTTEIDQGRQKVDNFSLDLEQLITSKLGEFTDLHDDSQQLIKLVKSETHNKLLEDQLATMKQTCQNLQQELTELRLKNATDAEHWKTIEALFSAEKSHEKITKQTAIDATTNTDAPVPAERKLTPEVVGRRKSLIEMADKNMSPIGSPDRKALVKLKTDIGIQTVHVADNPNTSENTQSTTVTQEMSENKDKLKERQDAIVQTSAEAQETKSFGVQTAVENVEIIEVTDQNINSSSNISKIEKKLQDAKQLAEERAENLKKTTAELTLANAEIDKLRKQLENIKTVAEETTQKQVTTKQEDFNQHAGIIEKTILSFHTLLSEKDKSINKYQDLLQTEREQTQSTTAKLNQNIEDLKSTVHNLNYNINAKDMEILELKTKLESVSIRRNSREKLDLATGASGGGGISGEDNGDNSLNEISDEKIEEMFEQADTSPVSGTQLPIITITEDIGTDKEEKQDKEVLKEIPALLKQIKELTDKASYWENTLKVKEEEINLLREKLQLYQEREKSLEHASSPEIEHLRLLLDDKDKHINELMSTLNNFHDDQQRYINDSTNSSADQITKLAADLTRTEATNKIYHTQVEALRRQLTSLTQREKQARELNQSLRSQLIKRPVVSIKTELNARVKNENLQRRIHQLELELEEARAQIQRQHIIIEAKRAKSASEVGMWEKQKRWQQNAEKFKAKLEETECTLEKTRSLLQSARNAVARLEKDKQVLEVKLSRATQSHGGPYGVGVKCCRTPSCPNLHPTGVGAKYTPSESPETYTGGSSECSSPAQSAQSCRAHTTPAQVHHYYGSNENHHGELIEALKARIELQQRKIIAMELEGKGSNALTTELEKQQERLSAIEAQNIRLEARNLQLQLDNDFLRQGDASERLQKRIKHLEDYIIALKEEMAQAEARRELCKCTGIKISTQTGQSAEQTILSLRNIVEKLRAENKYLKDGRRSTELRSTTDTATDLARLQQMYTESMEKISSLQIELRMKAKCPICFNRGKFEAHASSDEFNFIKEQLLKKTQLLQKAKVLLTRAAAKEKVLKEQLALWKRKCSELQNVPVIDEISE